MKPRMNNKEIRAFKHLLTQNHEGVLDILEWGSGGSTVYFTDFLESHSIPYTWTSIEYNKMWYEKIKEATKHKPSVALVLFDVGNNNLKQRNIPMDEYVNYPKTLNKKFDIIFVDGRKRRRCILEAKHLLKEGGVVLVHDARRHYYSCARAEYTNGVFIAPEFWKGSLSHTNAFQSLSQYIQNIVYGFLFWVLVFPFRIISNHAHSKISVTKLLLSRVSGFRSKIKIILLSIFFVLKKRGLGFFDFSFSLRLSSREVRNFSTHTTSTTSTLLEKLT